MKIRETVTGKRFKAALAGATIAVFLGVTGLVTVYAQGAPGQISPNPLDAILAKLDQVLATLNAAPATDVVLTTPILRNSDADEVRCAMANVGSTAFTYVYRAVTLGGGNAIMPVSGSLNPGSGFVGGIDTAGPNALRCEFRITGAPASSVRANIGIGQNASTSASADAR